MKSVVELSLAEPGAPFRDPRILPPKGRKEFLAPRRILVRVPGLGFTVWGLGFRVVLATTQRASF